jgi:hypothetical protein
MSQRIEIPSAWQTTDPKTRDDFRRVRVVLEQLELAMLELEQRPVPVPPASTYQDGGPQELSIAGLSGLAADPQRVEVAGAGVLISTRKRLNFISGANVTLGITDDALNDRANISIASAAFPALPGRIAARVHLGSAANTTAAGYQKVPLNTVTYDASGIWVPGSLAFRPTAAGIYHVSLRARVASSALSAAAIGKNGAAVIAVGYEGGTQLALGGSALVQVNGTTDTIDAWVACSSVVAYSVSANDTYMDICGPFGP